MHGFKGAVCLSPVWKLSEPALKEKGIPIEEAFKHVRVAVNKATGGRQTPWDSSSLTEDFEFISDADHPGARTLEVKRTVEEWRRELRGKDAETADDLIVAAGTDESYEAFVDLYAKSSFGPQARDWLDRHRRMMAWNKAVIINTAAGYHAFLAQYPDSDLTLTARKLEERLQYRADKATASTTSTSVRPETATAPSALQPEAARHAVQKTETPARKPKHAERRATPRAPSYGGGGSYGGYSRSGY